MAGLTKTKIDAIRRLTAKGYTQKEVAEKTGVSPKTVSKYAGKATKSRREPLEDKVERYFAMAMLALHSHEADVHELSRDIAHQPPCPYCVVATMDYLEQKASGGECLIWFKCPECGYETKPVTI